MENYNNNIEESGTFDFRTIINIVFGKWYIIAASLFICLVLGATKIYFSPKVYSRYATLLVKDSKMGVSGMNEAVAFADMAGLSSLSQSYTENEMLILQSRGLMEKTVLKLNAHISYHVDRYFRQTELYMHTPFTIVEDIPGASLPSAFVIRPIDTHKFEYISEDTTFVASFDKDYLFPFGHARIESYPNILENFIDEEISVYINNVTLVANSYLGALSVSLVNRDASVVQIVFNYTQPNKASDILNTLIHIYEQETINEKNKVLENSSTFIQERLASIALELSDIDNRIEGYKKRTLSTNLNTESSLYLQNASKLEESISNIEIQAGLVQILKDFLSKPANKRELLPYNIGIDNNSLNSQIEAYNNNLMKLNRLIDASSERNPIVSDINATLESLRSSIVKTVYDLDESFKLKKQSLATRTASTTGKIESVSVNERNLLTIERDQKIKAELYLYLLNKSEENSIMKSMTESNSRLIDSAYGSIAPISPSKKKILLLSLIMGLALPIGFYIAIDLLNTKVIGKSDVSAVVSAPILGAIPKRYDEKSDSDIMISESSSDHISEAFRILRTNLNFLNVGEDNKVIAMTSSMPGEGKTYVTMNLGKALSLTGKRVCILDLDLRRHSMSTAFGLNKKKGITDYLCAQESNLDTLITKVDDLFYILPAGMTPPNPSELLISDRYMQLINSIKDKFDYILLDNPPAFVVADASISSRYADTTLFIVRAGLLDKSELVHIEDLYKENKFNNLNIVVTDIDFEKLYYSVGYKGYGKSYSYGYKYSANKYY